MLWDVVQGSPISRSLFIYTPVSTSLCSPPKQKSSSSPELFLCSIKNWFLWFQCISMSYFFFISQDWNPSLWIFLSHDGGYFYPSYSIASPVSSCRLAIWVWTTKTEIDKEKWKEKVLLKSHCQFSQLPMGLTWSQNCKHKIKCKSKWHVTDKRNLFSVLTFYSST
jgi:hypothetical protein